MVWHHGLTFHQAASKKSKKIRRVFKVVYISSKVKRIKSWSTLPLDRELIEVDEQIRGDGMPILWPPQDQLPDALKIIGEASGPQYRTQVD